MLCNTEKNFINHVSNRWNTELTSIGYMDVWAIAPAVAPAANLSTTLISFLSPLINFFIYNSDHRKKIIKICGVYRNGQYKSVD